MMMMTTTTTTCLMLFLNNPLGLLDSLRLDMKTMMRFREEDDALHRRAT